MEEIVEQKELTDAQRVDDLKDRLFARLNEEPINSTDEVINLYDLKNILISELGEYNELFFKKSKKILINFNTRQLFKNNNFYIDNIIPSVNNNICYVEIELRHLDESRAGSILLTHDYDHPELLELDSSLETAEKIEKILDDNKIQLLVYSILSKLETFKEKYPNVDYVWSKEHPTDNSKMDFDDGFVNISFNINILPTVFATFSNNIDFQVGLYKIGDSSRASDHLLFHIDRLLKRTATYVNDLCPFYKEVLNKRFNQDKSRTLSK